MHAILVPMGSYGDVHPFVGLGRELRRRGHDVTVVTSAYFGDLVRKAELQFVPLGEPEDYLNAAGDPKLWHPIHGFGVVTKLLLTQTQAVYDYLCKTHRPGETVVAAAGMAFGARIAHEKLNVPLATIHLQPICFLSEFQTSVAPNGFALPDRCPRWIKRALFRAADWQIQRHCGRPLNAFRRSIGLKPVRRVLFDWWHSPQRVIGFFPEWFAAPQPDWPQQTELVGFPLYDESDLAEPDEKLNEFLESGDKPIVFTPGSGNLFGHDFFRAAVDVCLRLDRRGILLTRYPEHVPPNLPASVRHIPFVPFSRLLGRCAASVHHGGIGTTSQSIRHGVPQLIMPLSHDQPDNAARIRRMGIGASIKPAAFRGDTVAPMLRRLLDSAEVAENCQQAAERTSGCDALSNAADLIESL